MELDKIVLNRKEWKLLNKINFLTDYGNKRLIKAEIVTSQPEFDLYYFYQLRNYGLVETHHYPEPEESYHYRPDNGIASTQKGLHYNDWHWEHLRQFLYRSVTVPVIVSIIANLVILVVKHFYK